VTTYPFVAFLALQPRRSPGGSSSRSSGSQPPSLTILSRHQGPCTPSNSSSAPTSAESLTHHLTHQLLPRVRPFLERIHATQRERDRDRQLREEQDRAFRDAARRDKERIEEKMAEERREQERNRMIAEEKQRKVNEAEEQRKEGEVRMEWRRWARRVGMGVQGKVRIAVRLPNGGRVVKMMEETATLTALYLLVDTQLIPAELTAQDDPSSPPGYEGDGVEEAIEKQIGLKGEEWWGFRIFLAYPRIEIPWKKGRRIGEVECLRGGGGQVVVEMFSDGYHTEDDSE
jgi:FAS-associated factor 2